MSKEKLSQDIPKKYDPEAIEERWYDYWTEHNHFQAEVDEDSEPFTIMMPPPNVTGRLHIGHALQSSVQDAVIRIKRMQGHQALWLPGTDHAGIATQNVVERNLKEEEGKDRHDIGREAFVERAWDWKERYGEIIIDQMKRLGTSCDWSRERFTLDEGLSEAVTEVFVDLYEDGYIYRGDFIVNWCPRCQTAIAANEVEYDEITSPSIYVKFPLKGREGNLVIWTTTPWTIPANTFVAVDGEMTYQEVRAEKDGESEVLYLAEPCVEAVLKKGRYEDYEVLSEVTGEEMVGWEYDHPLAGVVTEYADFEGAGQVYTADYVEADRTGLVHSAPGHGQEDFARGQELGLDVFVPVDDKGEFTEQGGDYAGTFVRDANPEVIEDLDELGHLLHAGEHDHRYGHCWRCDTDIIFLATDQWFITVTDVKDQLLDNIEESEWHPDWARDNRFRDFVSDAPDWNVSRQRYWGIPLPIWVPQDADAEGAQERIVVGTREELAERADQNIDPETVDLHRPSVDPITITEDGVTYERVPDVFDVWIDSSVATWGTLDFPGETEAYDELWPADLIIEAHDQTRGWFWSQLGMGTAATGESPYKEVIMHGFANDKDGRKMSKSVGNIVTPEEAIDRAGRDPLRAYLLSHDQQGVDLAFEWDGLADTQSTLNIFWNVFRFPLPYMDLDGYDPAEADRSDGELTVVDEWVLSRLQTVEAEMADAWDDYEVSTALNALLDFITKDVSRFYVKAIRERMWDEADSASKLGAYATLSTVLSESIRLIAPYAPYMAERMYQRLDGSETSVHMLSYPEADEELRDEELEANMAVLRDVEEAAAHARQLGGRKLRWPVSRIVVESKDDAVAEAVDALSDLLAERVNTRDVQVVEVFDELVETAEPQMSVIGPEFGADAQKIMEAVEGLSRAEVESGVAVDGETYDLTDEMVSYRAEPPEHVSGADFEGGTVYVDTELTDDIESEGYARDVIRRIQEMRKQLDLDVEAEIDVSLAVDDERVAGFVAENSDLIAEEVRAREFDLGSAEGETVETWDVEDVSVTIAVTQLD